MPQQSKLMTLFREQMAKSKVAGDNSKAECDVMYSTGFLAFDYMNGTIVHVKSDSMDSCYNSSGIVDEASNAFIGRPACGKSTIVVQIMGNMMRNDPRIMAYFDDIEGSLPMTR